MVQHTFPSVRRAVAASMSGAKYLSLSHGLKGERGGAGRGGACRVSGGRFNHCSLNNIITLEC